MGAGGITERFLGADEKARRRVDLAGLAGGARRVDRLGMEGG
ncbi:MAG: hypothetical protein Q7I92_13825 [Humidesulfovibrio sp.]|nr:hypothetical protein [Humidesulfovibrio sp.]